MTNTIIALVAATVILVAALGFLFFLVDAIISIAILIIELGAL